VAAAVDDRIVEQSCSPLRRQSTTTSIGSPSVPTTKVWCRKFVAYWELDRIVSYRIVSYRIVSYRVVSFRIVSYRILLYRIVLYQCNVRGSRNR